MQNKNDDKHSAALVANAANGCVRGVAVPQFDTSPCDLCMCHEAGDEIDDAWKHNNTMAQDAKFCSSRHSKVCYGQYYTTPITTTYIIRTTYVFKKTDYASYGVRF